jgi:hypothetical protein
MNTAYTRLLIVAIGLTLPFAAGCNSKGPRMVRIHGTVSYKGAPLTSVTQGIVRYLPKDPDTGAREATGRVQPDGSFVMTTFQKDDGVIVGDYAITVSAYSTHELTRQETESGLRATGPKLLIPDKYLKSDTSGLTDSVAAGHPGFKNIELSDKS